MVFQDLPGASGMIDEWNPDDMISFAETQPSDGAGMSGRLRRDGRHGQQALINYPGVV